MKPLGKLVAVADGTTIVERVSVADTFLTRLVGLQFRRALASDAGLLIVPCSSIHTACLRFAIDVAFLDDSGTVVEVRRGLKPWRIAMPASRAHAVLETTAGTLDRLMPGVRVRFVGGDGNARRSALQFWS